MVSQIRNRAEQRPRGCTREVRACSNWWRVGGGKLWAPATHTPSLDLDSPLAERLEHPRVTTGGPSYRTRVSTIAWGMGLRKHRGEWRGPSITAVSKEPVGSLEVAQAGCEARFLCPGRWQELVTEGECQE